MRSVFSLIGLECWRIWKAKAIVIFLFAVAAGPLGFRLLTGEIIQNNGVNSIRTILLGGVVILLSVRGFPIDFEFGMFRSMLLQGIKRKQIVIARILAMTLVSSITILPWEINKFLINKPINLVLIEFSYSVALDLCISLGFASVFTAIVFLGKETFGVMLSVLLYIVDFTIFFLTQTSPPILGADSLGGAGSIILNLSKFSISIQGFQYSYPEIYGKSPTGIINFIIFGIILTQLSILLFERIEFTH